MEPIKAIRSVSNKLFSWWPSWSSRSDGSRVLSDVMNLGNNKDPYESLRHKKRQQSSDQKLRDLYKHPIVRKVVDRPADDSTKNPYIITHKDPDIAKKLSQFLKDIGWYKILSKAQKYARRDGGGYILVDYGDNIPMSMEVNLRRAKYVKLIPVSRAFMKPVYFKHFEEIEYFQLNGTNHLPGYGLIHKSRVFWIRGEETDEYTFLANGARDESIVDMILPELEAVDFALSVTVRALKDFSTYVRKVKFLDKKIKFDNEHKYLGDLAKEHFYSNVAGYKLIDQDEEVIKVATELRGVPPILEVLKDWLATVVDWPRTLFFGVSSTGGLKDGEAQSEKRDYAEKVTAIQINKQEEHIQRILNIKCFMERWEQATFCFADIYKMSEQQEADLEHKEAETEKLKAETEKLRNTPNSDGQEPILSVEEIRQSLIEQENNAMGMVSASHV